MLFYDHEIDRMIIKGKPLDCLSELGCIMGAMIRSAPEEVRKEYAEMLLFVTENTINKFDKAPAAADDRKGNEMPNFITEYIKNIINQKGE